MTIRKESRRRSLESREESLGQDEEEEEEEKRTNTEDEKDRKE